MPHTRNEISCFIGNLWAVLVAGVLMLSVGACAANLNNQSQTTESLPKTDGEGGVGQSKAPVRIAMLLPLAGIGATAEIAKAMKQAGEMALIERANSSVQLIVKDDKGTADGAAIAASEAIQEGAEVILGPLFATAVPGAARIARNANVPVIAFSNDERVAGQGVYLMSFLPGQEVRRIVSYTKTTGAKRYAALIPNNTFGQTVEVAFRQAVAGADGQIVALERYTPSGNGHVEPAQRVFGIVKQSHELGGPIDALFLPGDQKILPKLGPLYAYSGLDKTNVKLIGTGGWEFPNIGRDKAFVGGWYPSPEPHGWQSFSGRFAQNFGNAPPRIASLAYDAVNMAIDLSAAPQGARFTGQRIANANGFNGVDGPIRFQSDGRSNRSLAILEVQSFGSRVISPAAAANGRAPLSIANSPPQQPNGYASTPPATY